MSSSQLAPNSHLKSAKAMDFLLALGFGTIFLSTLGISKPISSPLVFYCVQLCAKKHESFLAIQFLTLLFVSSLFFIFNGTTLWVNFCCLIGVCILTGYRPDLLFLFSCILNHVSGSVVYRGCMAHKVIPDCSGCIHFCAQAQEDTRSFTIQEYQMVGSCFQS